MAGVICLQCSLNARREMYKLPSLPRGKQSANCVVCGVVGLPHHQTCTGITEIPLKCDILEVTEVGVGVNDDHWVLVELPLRMWVATIGYLRRTFSVQPGSSLVMYTGFSLRWVGFSAVTRRETLPLRPTPTDTDIPN